MATGFRGPHVVAQQADPVAVGYAKPSGDERLLDAMASMAIVAPSGQELVRIQRPVDELGRFQFYLRHLPSLPGTYGAAVTVTAHGYLPAKANVQVEIKREGAKTLAVVSPSHIYVQLEPFNPWLTALAFAPAIFGLLVAVMHLTGFSRGVKISNVYVIGNAIAWSAVVAVLVILYSREGLPLIALFWPDLFVSSGVIIAAFVGTVVYAAYSIFDKGGDFFATASDSARRQLMITLGGRILVAPYIALIAHGIFGAAFPSVRTGAFALFFGFFCGLWIKVVLEALNDIGTRFLSTEQKQKIADIMSGNAALAEPSAITARASLVPDRAFLVAVEAARAKVLETEGVATVEVVAKDGEPALRAYVFELDGHAVPQRVDNFAIEVMPLPPAAPTDECWTLPTKLSWSKVHTATQARIKQLATPPRPILVHQDQHVLVCIDPDASLFWRTSSGYQVFDVLGAYLACKTTLGDRFDFVSFAVDLDSGLPQLVDHHVSVFSDIQGINYFATGNPGSYAEPSSWGSSRLRACSVFGFKNTPTLWRYLHELGHYWCAYVAVRSGGGNSLELHAGPTGNSTQALYHWGGHFDDGCSPMDEDILRWKALGDGKFVQSGFSNAEIQYCPLDLYLMGLCSKEEVGILTVLRNVKLQADGSVLARPEAYTVDDVIAACGPRVPDHTSSPKAFRQALVVITRDGAAGTAYAAKLNAFRIPFETRFHAATDQRATLSTSLT